MLIYGGGALAIILSSIIYWLVTVSIGYEIIHLELFISIIISLWAILLPSIFSIVLAVIHSFFLGAAFYAENVSSGYYFVGGLMGMFMLGLIFICISSAVRETKVEAYLRTVHRTRIGKIFFSSSKGIITFCIMYDVLTLLAAYELFVHPILNK